MHFDKLASTKTGLIHAEWPDGITRTLTAGAAASVGIRQLSSIWTGGVELSDQETSPDENQEASALATDEQEEVINEDRKPEEDKAGKVIFSNALQRLATLVQVEDTHQASTHEIRKALTALRINRHFLLELIDTPNQSTPCPAFQHAMADFRKARDCMAGANLKLAFFHAKKYMYSGEPLDDLAQEGNIGLLKAVDRYDWRRGFRFSTYATWWIRQQISRYIADKTRAIRIPVHIHEKVQRMERMSLEFETKTYREPSLDELTKLMEMPSHKLIALQRSVPKACYIDELHIDDMIEIDAYLLPDPADVANKIQLNQAADRFISSLSTKDRKEECILRMRFGMGVNEDLTLDEIGSRLEVTRERIRQIEAKAIKKLRQSARSGPFARRMLGLAHDEPSFFERRESVEASGIDDVALLQESVKLVNSLKPNALDRVLKQAVELGIPVEAAFGRIWVNLVDTPDDPHQRLARKLLKFGFKHSPEKGYWR